MDLQQPRLIDYHIHSAVTVDANASECEACKQATSRGIRQIAFTNHVMLNQPAYRMSLQACTAHWQRVQACQKDYPNLTIRLGMEMDYYPGREAEIAAALRAYENALGRPFDVVLGSVHELESVFFSNQHHAPALYQGRDLSELYRAYFKVATQAVRSRLFDVMAHPNLIRKYTYELTPPLAFEQYQAAVEEYILALLETETGIELNTKGLRTRLCETYPSKQMLTLYVTNAAASGSEAIVTIGSDAHVAEDVGDHVLEGALLLRDLGITELATFEGHRRVRWEL